jgi:hypothetical protein
MNPHAGHNVVNRGFYQRQCDKRRIQRFYCRTCSRGFSKQTYHHTYRQRKPWINNMLVHLLCSSVSQRRAARILKVQPLTVARKIPYLAAFAARELARQSAVMPAAEAFQFDEMVTFEHSKLKPVSIIVAVESRSRRILDVRAFSIRPEGAYSDKAMRRYGPRKHERKQNLRASFAAVQPQVIKRCTINSDCHKAYKPRVREFFPQAYYERFLSRKACVTGQGEMKRGGFDPLFWINHTCAMVRYGVKRLARKTWCTTKKVSRLNMVLQIYRWYHNTELIKPITTLPSCPRA